MYVYAAFFNNALSIWALGTAISLTHPKSHNTGPLGGRKSHQQVAEGPEALFRTAEITMVVIKGTCQDKILGFLI